ncbi:MAG TPA: inositol monophosphatase family protein [Candidatus Saccharimonadales bacterium]|nr:inositol monophosphatase family protein [Candidatus Saccharimonadales bacterium]
MISDARLNDLTFATKLARDQGEVMLEYFQQADLAVGDKADAYGTTTVTEADEQVSRNVVAAYAVKGCGVVSEERGRTAEYGDPNAMYLDPIDGTDDFVLGRSRSPRQSLAMFSLAQVVDGRPVIGVVNAPLLKQPRLYTAAEGLGAFCAANGDLTRIRTDTGPTEGIVLVSHSTRMDTERFAAKGFRPLPLGGSVFKACAVVDSTLLKTFDDVPHAQIEGLPVVGYVSLSTWAHDHAAAAVIARGAGAIVTGKDGGELSLQYGKQGCIFAVNDRVHAQLVDILQGQ